LRSAGLFNLTTATALSIVTSMFANVSLLRAI